MTLQNYLKRLEEARSELLKEHNGLSLYVDNTELISNLFYVSDDNIITLSTIDEYNYYLTTKFFNEILAQYKTRIYKIDFDLDSFSKIIFNNLNEFRLTKTEDYAIPYTWSKTSEDYKLYRSLQYVVRILNGYTVEDLILASGVLAYLFSLYYQQNNKIIFNSDKPEERITQSGKDVYFNSNVITKDNYKFYYILKALKREQKAGYITINK